LAKRVVERRKEELIELRRDFVEFFRSGVFESFEQLARGQKLLEDKEQRQGSSGRWLEIVGESRPWMKTAHERDQIDKKVNTTCLN
jgi:hypothetical protein